MSRVPATLQMARNAVGEEGFLGSVARGGFLVPEPDQQVGRHTHQLPEHEEHQEVVGQDDTQHGEHEQAQRGEEPGIGPVVMHVAGGVNHHQRSHTGDHHQHQRRQGIDVQADLCIQTGHRKPVERRRIGRLAAENAEQGEAEQEGNDHPADVEDCGQ